LGGYRVAFFGHALVDADSRCSGVVKVVPPPSVAALCRPLAFLPASREGGGGGGGGGGGRRVVSFGSRHMHERTLAAWQRAAARGGGVILPGFFMFCKDAERGGAPGLGTMSFYLISATAISGCFNTSVAEGCGSSGSFDRIMPNAQLARSNMDSPLRQNILILQTFSQIP